MRIKHKEDKRLTIQYETGQERKKLVVAAAEQLGEKPVYAGAPTMNYILGAYTVACDRTLAGPDDHDLVTALREQGYEPVEETYNAEPAEPEAEANLPQPGRLTIEVPIDSSFTLIKMSNLKKLIASRETLLKKVLGTDALPIEQGDGTLRFPWFPLDDNAMVYKQLVCALVRVATESIRITAREKPTESEKFRMRTFLLRLNFIGPEYKKARKILTRGLSGNGSYAKDKESLPPQETPDAKADRWVAVARPPEGISLNGATEFLLDDDNQPMVFDNPLAAETFLLEHGYPQEALEDLRCFPPTN